MFEQTTRVLSESLARAVNRRTFLKRASQGTFAVVATIAAGHGLSTRATAAKVGPQVDPLAPQCAPPGPYCNLDGVNTPNGCHGAHCFQHMNAGVVRTCRVYYAFYPSGCWTYYNPTDGSWTCCDCRCDNGSTCGCAQFSPTPITLGE